MRLAPDADGAQTQTDTPTDTAPPAPGTKAALQLALDAATARIASLEADLGNAAADREASVEQLRAATNTIQDLREQLAERGESMAEIMGRVAKAGEAVALASLGQAAWDDGRPDVARALRERAHRLLG